MKRTFVLLFSLLMLNSIVAQENSNQIEVAGISEVEQIPENISISIPLKVTDSTYLECSVRLNRLLKDLQADLIKRGFEESDLRSDQYVIAEHFEYEQGKRVFKGYRGSVQIHVLQAYDEKLMGQFLNSAQGYQLNYTLRFELSEDQKKEMSKRAMQEAVIDASEKASILAAAAGVRLGSISKISYGVQDHRPSPLMEVSRLAQSDMSSGGSEALNLNPGEISVRQSVRMVWTIDQ